MTIDHLRASPTSPRGNPNSLTDTRSIKKGEWVNSASYKKCKELFLKDTSRLKSFTTLSMYKDTAGNAVT